MRKHELVIIWETGEKEVHEYESQELAEQAERGYKAAFGNQIQWSGTRPQTQKTGAGMSSVDETRIVNGELPKTWTCPHCHRRNKMGRYKNEEFIEFGKAFQHCDHCSYVHYWQLELTEDFKRKVVEMLTR